MDTPLRKARIAKGLTGVEVARAVKISQGQYSRIERGLPCSPSTAERLTAFLGRGVIDELRILYPQRYQGRGKNGSASRSRVG